MTNSTKKPVTPQIPETETVQASKLSLTILHFDGTTSCSIHDNHSTIYKAILDAPTGMKGVAFYIVGICSKSVEVGDE